MPINGIYFDGIIFGAAVVFLIMAIYVNLRSN